MIESASDLLGGSQDEVWDDVSLSLNKKLLVQFMMMRMRMIIKKTIMLRIILLLTGS